MEKAVYLLVCLTFISPMVSCEECSAVNINKATNISMYIYNTTSSCKEITEKCGDCKYLYNATQWTLGEGRNKIRFAVDEIQSVALELINLECNRSIWTTNRPEIIVSTVLLSSMKKPAKSLRKTDVYETMVQVCRMKQLQTRNLLTLIQESTLTFYVTILVLVIVIWKVLSTLFNILINCCTLRKLNMKRKSCCCSYIFFGLCSSLTNRQIFVNQQRDIDSLKIDQVELLGGKYKNDFNADNAEFISLKNEIYGFGMLENFIMLRFVVPQGFIAWRRIVLEPEGTLSVIGIFMKSR